MSAIAIRSGSPSWSATGLSHDAQRVATVLREVNQHLREPVSRTTTARRFADLAETWKRETELLSSIQQVAMTPAYQEIIGLGQAVVPLILQDLRREPEHWFWALAAITGENPVRTESRGNVP